MILTPKIITRKLLFAIGLLLICHLFVLYLRFGLGHLTLHGMISMFNFDDERNLPTLFSGLLILSCAVTLWRVSKTKTENQAGLTFYWKALSAFTLFLFLDEIFSIHEIANHKMFKDIWPYGDGFFYFAWVVPYLFLVGVAFLFFIKFLMKLPAATRIQFITAGAIYAGGALGMELIGGKYHHHNGPNVYYFVIITIEELLEMLGMVRFFSAILKHFFTNTEKEKVVMQVAFQGDHR